MIRFSERYNLAEEIPMQIDAINERTRNRIWNRVKEALPDYYRDDVYCRQFAAVLFDELGLNAEYAEQYFSEHIKKSILQEMAWNEVYDLVELLLDILPEAKAKRLAGTLNSVLESENCAYRVLCGIDKDRSVYQVQRITNELELQELEKAAQTGYDVVNERIMDAVSRYSDYENPDYAGAVHSAVSAVESVMRTADKTAKTLGEAIKHVKKADVSLNPRLLEGLDKLYGYACETVRHGTAEPVEVTQSEARLLIVLCSAIVNYLIARHECDGVEN